MILPLRKFSVDDVLELVPGSNSAIIVRIYRTKSDGRPRVKLNDVVGMIPFRTLPRSGLAAPPPFVPGVAQNSLRHDRVPLRPLGAKGHQQRRTCALTGPPVNRPVAVSGRLQAERQERGLRIRL